MRPEDLIDCLPQLVDIADLYKNEIGFWPRSALEDAVRRGRLLAAMSKSKGRKEAVGFIVFGGVFPNGRIQAIAVHPLYLRQGVAQFLLDNVVARMEAEGYLAISAKPAEDLEAAQEFYQKNRFSRVRTQRGGASRKRMIVVRERILGSPSLLRDMTRTPSNPFLTFPEKRSNLWVIDVNVLLDLVKARRTQYDLALKVFSAALEGRIKIAVTSEFTIELSRATTTLQDDPLLALASALPRLRQKAGPSIKHLSQDIHGLIFKKNKPSQAGTPQALSDCSHLAECISGNATAFVTSDGVLLRSRRIVRETWGVEIVSLEDFHDAILSTDPIDDFKSMIGMDFRLRSVDAGAAWKVYKELDLNCSAETFFDAEVSRISGYYLAAFDDDGSAIGILASSTPASLGDARSLLLLVDHERPNAELVAETLLGNCVEAIGRYGFNLLNLVDVPGQIIARKVALQAGFVPNVAENRLNKATAGAPVTPSSFPILLERSRFVFGAAILKQLPDGFEAFDEIFSEDRSRFRSIEDLISPTLIVANNRKVSIQPIARSFADELLGTSRQTSLLEQFEGAFRSNKTYVSSGRSKNFFNEDQIILFYESSRTGGRGAIVAAARVDSVVTQVKKEMGQSDMKRTVVETVDRFSASEEVTLINFSLLLRFPEPVNLKELRNMGASGAQNLQTATVISTAVAQRIFDLGWSGGR